jgi:hypothetical protein
MAPSPSWGSSPTSDCNIPPTSTSPSHYPTPSSHSPCSIDTPPPLQHSENPTSSPAQLPTNSLPTKLSAPNRHVQSTINTFHNRRNLERNSDSHNGIPWGHYPESDKTGCRILFQNVNGIPHSNKYAKAHALGMELDSIQADIIGLAETNLDWSTDRNINKCRSIFRNYWKQTKIGFCSSNCHTNKYFQPGGVASITTSNWSSHSTIINDPSGLGRWTETEITGKKGITVSIITAYAVCKDSIERSGTTTAFTQQWNLLKLKEPESDHDPRERLFRDLGQHIDHLRSKHHEIILLIDANESLQTPNSSFTGWVQRHCLNDALVQVHGTDDEPATHARGTHRIDYILTTDIISEFITSAGILPLFEVCYSDHRALFIDIDLKGYLQTGCPPTISRANRGISSDDPRTIQKYQQLLARAIKESQIEEKIKEIE